MRWQLRNIEPTSSLNPYESTTQKRQHIKPLPETTLSTQSSLYRWTISIPCHLLSRRPSVLKRAVSPDG
ncbi:uncharacterized protein BCR38DRAFT_415584 [Pseudomassariella vexata]|uniref:Uncharacterized protein n=1 Tax=Pseudomassariella vexata TaxID=1141098 RepID=A0A1Y2EHB4_9PEZI|nr:uncharacterized protein BCR38DRAFT_415584 [Pseudomassariella vexata]ORY70958.1 hypothetical protein BCR38DRAFT_415584 [Pseudomassariella vexata]